MQSNIRNAVAVAAVATFLGTATALGAPINVRGTIVKVSGNRIDVKERDGSSATVHLADDAKIASVEKASLSDVKPGSYIGTAAAPQPDGSLQAIEIHIFPASMRGTGEGTRNWNLTPKSTMTNGTVAQVDKVAGDKLTVDYRGGQKVVSVTPKTEVVTLVPGNRSDLKPDTKVFVPAAVKAADGTLEANRVTVGKGAIAPPM